MCLAPRIRDQGNGRGMSEHLYRKVDPGQPTPWWLVKVDGPVYLWCRVHRRLWSRSVCGSVCDDFMRLVEIGEEQT